VEAEEEIKRASVICLVYAVDDIRSFHRLGTYWLPFIRSINAQFHATAPCPVILVGNKIDTRGLDVTNEELEEEILPLMSDFKEIETCVECSAKSLINVPEVFYFAQKAVLHPTAPLYDSKEHFLKPACVFALERIFHLCDTNKDGFLSDEEINRFQMKCFKIPLQKEELEGIKEVIKENDPTAVMDKGITKSGKAHEVECIY
jgi:Ras family protein T1